MKTTEKVKEKILKMIYLSTLIAMLTFESTVTYAQVDTSRGTIQTSKLNAFVTWLWPYVQWILGGLVVWQIVMIIIAVTKEERELGGKFLTLGLAIIMWISLPSIASIFGITIN